MAQCIEMVHHRSAPRIMGRGTESTTPGAVLPCSRSAVEGDTMCATHGAKRDRIRTELARRREASSK